MGDSKIKMAIDAINRANELTNQMPLEWRATVSEASMVAQTEYLRAIALSVTSLAEYFSWYLKEEDE